MNDDVSSETLEAIYLANEFISQVHDIKNISKLFVMALTIPIERKPMLLLTKG